MHRDVMKANIVVKLDGKKPVERSTHRLEDNIKMKSVVNWIYPGLERIEK
jgi:hypothetical protein